MKTPSHLKTITTIRFPIDHVKDLLLYSLPGSIPGGPIIPCTDALFANEEVLWIVDVLVSAGLDSVDDLKRARIFINP